MGDTSMRCSEDLLDELHARSERGESYEDVVWRVLDRVDELEAQLEDEVAEGVEQGASDIAEGRTSTKEDVAEAVDGNVTQQRSAVDVLDDLRDDLPGSGPTLTKRLDVAASLVDVLQEADGDVVTTQELKEHIDPEKVGYASVDSYWSNFIKKSNSHPNVLTAVPGVEEIGNGRYRYTE